MRQSDPSGWSEIDLMSDIEHHRLLLNLDRTLDIVTRCLRRLTDMLRPSPWACICPSTVALFDLPLFRFEVLESRCFGGFCCREKIGDL